MVALPFIMEVNMEKPKRKKIDKQDLSIPTTIEEFIQRYEPDKMWEWIDKIIDYINEKEE